RDLELRGPGEFFGTRQAGFPDFEVAHLLRDVHLLEAARREAFSLLEEDPDLASYPLLSDALRQRWEGTLALATVG
ncbi:MAG: DNA helicase RecG, partial [candidate division NC10 bacterium]